MCPPFSVRILRITSILHFTVPIELHIIELCPIIEVHLSISMLIGDPCTGFHDIQIEVISEHTAFIYFTVGTVQVILFAVEVIVYITFGILVIIHHVGCAQQVIHCFELPRLCVSEFRPCRQPAMVAQFGVKSRVQSSFQQITTSFFHHILRFSIRLHSVGKIHIVPINLRNARIVASPQ